MKLADLLEKYGYCPEEESGLEINMEIYYEEDETINVHFSSDGSSGASYKVNTVKDLVTAFKNYLEDNM